MGLSKLYLSRSKCRGRTTHTGALLGSPGLRAICAATSRVSDSTLSSVCLCARDPRLWPSGMLSTSPRERLLRLDDVVGRVGLRTTAIYQRMRAGEFPKAVPLGGRCVAWPESEIDAWVLATITKARAPDG